MAPILLKCFIAFMLQHLFSLVTSQPVFLTIHVSSSSMLSNSALIKSTNCCDVVLAVRSCSFFLASNGGLDLLMFMVTFKCGCCHGKRKQREREEKILSNLV
ncbi:conserved hypothetical protein [Ricinus communis]|uniref:Secreted protein n=1 Tax=Ricinus communis TaxID=3988 RepID=B9SZR8_RICCO|nr:conserved hypothetical protein [Ricinus communis]